MYLDVVYFVEKLFSSWKNYVRCHSHSQVVSKRKIGIIHIKGSNDTNFGLNYVSHAKIVYQRCHISL